MSRNDVPRIKKMKNNLRIGLEALLLTTTLYAGMYYGGYLVQRQTLNDIERRSGSSHAIKVARYLKSESDKSLLSRIVFSGARKYLNEFMAENHDIPNKFQNEHLMEYKENDSK